MERTIADLPSKDFFLKTLDSPAKAQIQPPDLDEDDAPAKSALKPQRQVDNTPPATIAAANKP